jgi:hypothetical protein
MRIPEAERLLADSILRIGSANPQLYEELAQSLLAEHAAHRPRSLDGLFLVQEQCDSGTVRATAIAVTVDNQAVHPMSFSLAIGSSGVLNEGSCVCFGQHDVKAPAYGSSQHNKLANTLLAPLSPELCWSVVLKRSQTGWSRDDA